MSPIDAAKQNKPLKQGKQEPTVALRHDSSTPLPAASSLGASSSYDASSSSSSAPSRRLLFVEVRGPRGRRRQALQYDRTARELKSHVMVVTNEGKRRRPVADSSSEDHDWKAERKSMVVRHNTRLSPELSPQHADPFNMLPVEGTPEMHAAIRYYFEHYPGPTPMTDDSLVCHKNAYRREMVQWNRVQFSFVQDQRISYYIMLFIWQVMKNLSKEIDLETSKYWAQVLHVMREDLPLGKTGTSISESYVAMVGGLAVAETWLGNFSNSQKHRSAMLKLVAARGGFSTFGPMAQRALKWCEYYSCAAMMQRPGLPPLPVQPLHNNTVKMAEAAHRRTMALLPQQLAHSQLNVILFQLHIVTLEHSETPQAPLASVIDDLEYRILNALAERKEPSIASALTVRLDVVHYALLQAAQMCVFATMTFARKEMPLQCLFVATLRRTLSMPSIIDTWAAVATVDSLLWVLFIGWAAASQLRGDAENAIEDARWFLQQCFVVFEMLGVREENDLLNRLATFPWSSESYHERCKTVWSLFIHREDLNVT